MQKPIEKPRSQYLEQLYQQGLQLKADRAAGVPALRRLLPLAQGHTGQSRVIAHFLLSLYNGNRFKFDLTDFRLLDQELLDDCLAVLRMDSRPVREVHNYFEKGGQIWEQLAKDWNVKDYTKAGRSE
ncbi:hypothetical protein JOS77_27190 [Chromobacterium haemolyticum]|nr:hypothetical protein JOS77_27190 [Chromobacterium haemolyticum]